MQRFTTALFALCAAVGLGAAGAAGGQTLGGKFPIHEPAAKAKPHNKPSSEEEGKLDQIVVDAYGSGPYTTISAALKDVATDGVIYVMHGVYRENIALTKSVSIQGDRGPGAGVEIYAQSASTPCLEFSPKEASARAVISNVKIFAQAQNRMSGCIHVTGGVFTMTESDVEGSGVSPSVRIDGGTVMLSKNRITRGSEGVLVTQMRARAQSFVVDNKIANNIVGVDVKGNADIVVAGNEIFDNLKHGIESGGAGDASFIGNKIRNNKGDGVFLDRFAKMNLLRFNQIVKNQGAGIAIPNGAPGLIQDNEIVGNGGQAIFLRDGVLSPSIDGSNKIENNAGDCVKKRRGKCR